MGVLALASSMFAAANADAAALVTEATDTWELITPLVLTIVGFGIVLGLLKFLRRR